MILKDQSTKFTIELKETHEKEGLNENDVWYQTRIIIKNEEINYKAEGKYLSKNEVKELKKELIEFIKAKKTIKKRIAFIKNFLIFYLDFNSKRPKTLYLKLVHINNTKKNYQIKIQEEEITEVIDMITPKKD